MPHRVAWNLLGSDFTRLFGSGGQSGGDREGKKRTCLHTIVGGMGKGGQPARGDRTSPARARPTPNRARGPSQNAFCEEFKRGQSQDSQCHSKDTMPSLHDHLALDVVFDKGNEPPAPDRDLTGGTTSTVDSDSTVDSEGRWELPIGPTRAT
ncbi:hypothetical protein THAOC_18306, partial [Thalassiosira oceanica]